MASTTLNDNITIKGLDNIHETIEIKPLEIKPLNLNTKSELAVTQPIVTNSTIKDDMTAKLNLAIEPLRVESDQRSAIDVKPLAVDACQTLRLAPLPPTCVEQPYTHHFGFTFMGMEVWGFNISGRSEMAMRAPDPQRYHPVHFGGGSHSGGGSKHEHHHHGHQHHEHQHQHHQHDGGGGLRVRVGHT
jgi:hypothetical protein